MITTETLPVIRRVETSNDQSVTIIGRGKESAIEIGTTTGFIQIPVYHPAHLRELAGHLLAEADEMQRAQQRNV